MWQMSKLYLMDGIPRLMDGVRERGVMGLLSQQVQRLSDLFQLARMRMSQQQEIRQQSLSDRYLYPLVRVCLYLAMLLLQALVRLVSQVRQMYRYQVTQLPHRLDRYQSLPLQTYRQVETRLQSVWDRLRLLVQQRYPRQETLQQHLLAALRRLQAIRLMSVAQSLSRLRQALASMVTQLLGYRVIRSQYQQLPRLFGAWLMTAKQQAGRGLVQVKRQIGRLLMIARHLIGKR